MAGFLVSFAAELALVRSFAALQVLLEGKARVLGRDEACGATWLPGEKLSMEEKNKTKKHLRPERVPTIVGDEDGLLQGDVRQR